MGVSPRRLSGWEPIEVHECEYDDEGRLVRTIVQREPEFDENDLEMLTAHMLIKMDTGQYGESISEATSEKADPTYTGADAVRYSAGYRINHAVAAVDLLRENTKDLPKGAEFFVERETFE